MKIETLDDLGARLKTIDRQLVFLLAKRMELALRVGSVKAREKEKGKQVIFRQSVEDDRLQDARVLAKDFGLNPNFIHSLLYLIVNESCKQQMILMQGAKKEPVKAIEYADLKKNLVSLAGQWAGKYDRDYEKTFLATRMYLAFEQALIESEIAKVGNKVLLIDLGCATGSVALKNCQGFHRAVGYDLCPAMIERAKMKKMGGGFAHVEFRVADLDVCIPEPDKSASFVLLTLGTASDIKDLLKIISEIRRVLAPGGRFLISFYNKDALVYRCGDFLPWEVSLAAQINLDKDYLEVRHDGVKIPVYAKPLTPREAEGALSDFADVRIRSFPTILSVLPDAILHDDSVRELMVGIDHELSDSHLGAYLIATGQKV